MESIVFSGYEGKPVMAQKLAALVKMVEDLQKEVDKLKQPVVEKKTTKVKTTE